MLLNNYASNIRQDEIIPLNSFTGPSCPASPIAPVKITRIADAIHEVLTSTPKQSSQDSKTFPEDSKAFPPTKRALFSFNNPTYSYSGYGEHYTNRGLLTSNKLTKVEVSKKRAAIAFGAVTLASLIVITLVAICAIHLGLPPPHLFLQAVGQVAIYTAIGSVALGGLAAACVYRRDLKQAKLTEAIKASQQNPIYQGL